MFFKQKNKSTPDLFRQFFALGDDRDPDKFYEEYSSTSSFNFAAVVASRLANIVCTDASAYLSGEDSNNLFFMRDAFNCLISNLRLAVEQSFGSGGVLLKPFVYDGKIFVDVLPQSRLYPLDRTGSTLTKAAILSEGEDDFVRAEIHAWEGDVYSIVNRCFHYDKNRDRTEEVALSQVDAWKDIDREVIMPDLGHRRGKFLFAHLKSPVVNRAGDMVFGAPVTYGQDQLMGMIRVLMGEIPDEYKNKKAFIGADSLLFDKNNRLPESGLYKLFRGGVSVDNQGFWEVFSPQIRHESYIEGIKFLLSLLEKGIGVNKGILTDLDNVNSTATAIRRSTFDTFALVDLMRKNVESSVAHLLDCFDFIADSFDLYPDEGGCQLTPVFEWSYGLIEDSAETVRQFKEGFADGVISQDEYRRQIVGGEYNGRQEDSQQSDQTG